MSLALLGSILIDGVSYAMILFMITIGLSITMGLMRVVNLTHGAFAMIGGFLAAMLPIWFGWPPLLAEVIAVVAVAFAALPGRAMAHPPLLSASRTRSDASDDRTDVRADGGVQHGVRLGPHGPEAAGLLNRQR